MSSELHGWFASARVTQVQPSRYEVDLIVSPTLRSSLKDARSVLLAYHLMGENDVLFQGVVPCRIPLGQASAGVSLPNPDRVTARSIRFHLAR